MAGEGRGKSWGFGDALMANVWETRRNAAAPTAAAGPGAASRVRPRGPGPRARRAPRARVSCQRCLHPPPLFSDSNFSLFPVFALPVLVPPSLPLISGPFLSLPRPFSESPSLSRAFFLGLCFGASLSGAPSQPLPVASWDRGLDGFTVASAPVSGQGWEEGTGDVGGFNTSPPRVRADGGRAGRSRPASGKTLRETESAKSGEKWSREPLETSKGSQLFSPRFKSLKGIPGSGPDSGPGTLVGSGLSPSLL